MRQLDHPNIVRLYEVFQDDKRFYLVTELCQGGELFEAITKRTHFNEQVAASIIKQILSAIAYCHSKSIVHRDLKPENILLEDKKDDGDFQIKVIDFGASMRFDPSKKMNQVFGTAYYIAPEILKLEYNEKCDVWSVGVILYILLSGKPPFGGENDKEILDNVRTGIFSMSGNEWSLVSSEAKDLVKQMLTFDPVQRISAEEALNHLWIKKKFNQTVDLEATYNALNNLRAFRVNDS